MSSDKAIVRAGELQWSDEQRTLIRNTFLSGARDDEAAVLLHVAQSRGLDPFRRHIYFVKRWDSVKRCEVWSHQVAIDGFRYLAQRTGLYDGQDEPEFTDDAHGNVQSCRVRVYRKDWNRPAVGVAYLSEFVQTTKEGAPTQFWRKMPRIMLAKCAEALAMRKAFPEDLGGLYTPEEMGSDIVDAEEVRESKPHALPSHREQSAAVPVDSKPEPVPATFAQTIRAMHASAHGSDRIDATTCATIYYEARAKFDALHGDDLKDAFDAATSLLIEGTPRIALFGAMAREELLRADSADAVIAVVRRWAARFVSNKERRAAFVDDAMKAYVLATACDELAAMRAIENVIGPNDDPPKRGKRRADNDTTTESAAVPVADATTPVARWKQHLLASHAGNPHAMANSLAKHRLDYGIPIAEMREATVEVICTQLVSEQGREVRYSRERAERLVRDALTHAQQRAA